jgi:FtsP/CotA-like multicopper oxidase with cupredoxin domain
MRTSNHRKISRLISNFRMVCLALMLEVAAISSFAQNHMKQANESTPTAKAADIVRDPTDLPSWPGNRAPGVVHVTLTAKELVGVLDPASGTTYRYWTFNGKVPGPFIRVRQGDAVEVNLANAKDSSMVHSIDFHAAIGPGGGSALTQVPPGQSKSFTFRFLGCSFTTAAAPWLRSTLPTACTV